MCISMKASAQVRKTYPLPPKVSLCPLVIHTSLPPIFKQQLDLLSVSKDHLAFYVNSVKYVIFSVFFFSLRMIILRFIRIVLSICSLFLFEKCCKVWIYHCWFIHFLTYEYQVVYSLGPLQII